MSISLSKWPMLPRIALCFIFDICSTVTTSLLPVVGSATFSVMLNSGSRKWNWKTKPRRARRNAARSGAESDAVSRPSSRTRPPLGRSSSPSR